jgi:PAS domain S-box-containing protein
MEGRYMSNNSKDQDIGKPSPGIHMGAEELGLAEEAVRKAEIEYQVIFEAMGNATALIEDDLTITLANREFDKLSGYSREQIEGKKTLAEFLAPHDAREIRDYFSQRGENYNAPPKNYTILFTNQQGEPMEAVVTLTMVPQLRKSILSLAEVRKLREAEESLKSSEARFRSLFELSPVGIALSHGDSLIYVNPELLRMLGLDETTKLQGKTFMNFVAPISRQMITERPERRMQGQDMSGSPAEAIGLRKDGTTFPVQIEAFRIDLHDGPASVAFISDITEHKQAEAELRLRAQLLDAANDSIVVHDFSGSFFFVNEAACKLYGYTKAKMMQKNVFDLNTPEYKQLWESRTKILKEKGQLVFEVVNARKGGLYTTLEVNARLLEETVGEALVLCVSRDITERKKYEKEMARLDRLNLMGEIAAGIAHEIRNPMTVVRGYLQIMQLKEDLASHNKRFDTMIEELDRANAIITEFLSLARNAPSNLKKQSINSILTSLLPLIQADAAEHGITISLSLSDTPEINLDEQQIRQLILNLVRNGIEAMSRHGELTIKTCMKKNRVVLSIKDRGNGIPPDVLEKLGTPFFTTKEQGTGLGLPVCYRIAESHNARIEIKTGKRGTTFMVSFQVPSLQDEDIS